MNIENRIIWQQAAGDTNRDYVDLCLEWDVVLIGPAHDGPWPEREIEMDQYMALLRKNCQKGKPNDLKRFCVEMQEGDLVVLHLGTRDVYAVGEIVGSYKHHDEFNDVDGWDIGHLRRVRWLWKYSEQPKKFATYTLKWGSTTLPLKQRDDAPEVYEWLENLEVADDAYDHTPVELPPKIDRGVGVNDISEYLFGEGVSSSSISDLMNEIEQLVRVANWYRNSGMPSEHETVTFLVVPLLRALGWTQQKMAIEWSKIDVALFSKLPRDKQFLSAVVEAKKMDESCLPALWQAQHYANDLNPELCGRVVVTDGLRYGVFTRNTGESEFSLHAYLNLTRLRREYPLYACKGAQDALLAMAPEWSTA